MAKEIADLVATARTGTGKGAARQARRENLVPGIVYGGGADPLPINLPYNALIKKLKAGRFLSTLFNRKVEGQDDVRVICRDVQRDARAIWARRIKQISKSSSMFPLNGSPSSRSSPCWPTKHKSPAKQNLRMCSRSSSASTEPTASMN